MDFSLHFTNVDAFPRQFATADEAIAAGRKAGFEFTVWLLSNGKVCGCLVASWTVFGGLRLEASHKKCPACGSIGQSDRSCGCRDNGSQ